MNFSLDGFIDIHTHILPGLDDGPKDIAGSIAMARCYEKVGVKAIAATPHFLPGTAWAATKERVLESTQGLQLHLDREKIDLKIIPGMEIAYHRKLEERILANIVLPLGKTGFFLIEPSFQEEQEGLLACLLSLLNKGQKLILAHPERAVFFQQNPQALKKFIDLGLRIQVNAGSLLGYFGEKSKFTAELLRKSNCIHFIASDAHDHRKRGPLTASDWESLLASPGGQELFWSCKKIISQTFHLDLLAQ